jgi:hypothetical protein
MRHDDLSTADAVAERDTVFRDPLVADRSDVRSAGAGVLVGTARTVPIRDHETDGDAEPEDT